MLLAHPYAMGFRATILAGLALVVSGLPGAAVAERPEHPHEHIWLKAHNDERAEFGVPPLRWDSDLAREARMWAERLAREERLRHSSIDEREGRGENLWMGTAGYFRPEHMLAPLIDEKRHFRPGAFPRVSRTGNWADVGHYTQIVWADTREVGCAIANGRRFDVLVCRYWPAGNVMGQRIEPGRRIAWR